MTGRIRSSATSARERGGPSRQDRVSRPRWSATWNRRSSTGWRPDRGGVRASRSPPGTARRRGRGGPRGIRAAGAGSGPRPRTTLSSPAATEKTWRAAATPRGGARPRAGPAAAGPGGRACRPRRRTAPTRWQVRRRIARGSPATASGSLCEGLPLLAWDAAGVGDERDEAGVGTQFGSQGAPGCGSGRGGAVGAGGGAGRRGRRMPRAAASHPRRVARSSPSRAVFASAIRVEVAEASNSRRRARAPSSARNGRRKRRNRSAVVAQPRPSRPAIRPYSVQASSAARSSSARRAGSSESSAATSETTMPRPYARNRRGDPHPARRPRGSVPVLSSAARRYPRAMRPGVSPRSAREGRLGRSGGQQRLEADPREAPVAARCDEGPDHARVGPAPDGGG